MREFFPDALVRDYERLVPDMQNNPKDRHVLAAAVASRADYLVTFNLKHFPAAAVEQFDTAIVGPSTFLKNLWTQDQSVVEQRLKEQAVAIEISIRPTPRTAFKIGSRFCEGCARRPHDPEIVIRPFDPCASVSIRGPYSAADTRGSETTAHAVPFEPWMH